jgi:hypothetical protein
MLILKSFHQFGSVRRFFHQYLSHQVTDVDDLWIGDLIDNILRVSVRNDNTAVAQHPEVPGDPSLRVAGDTHDLAHPLRSIPQNMDNFDPYSARHTLAKISLDFEKRSLRHTSLHSPSIRPIGKQ